MYRGLIKVALIALPALALLGLLVAGVFRWRETANRARCQDNLRRLGWFAMWQYTDPDFAFPGGVAFGEKSRVLAEDKPLDPNKAFPPGTVPHATLPPARRLSWHVLLLPHLQRDDAYRKFDLSRAWDDEVNRDALMMKMPTLACPSIYRRPPPGEPQAGHYIGVAGLGVDAPTLPATDPRAGFFRYDGATTTGMIRRGFSYTMTILETQRDHGPWPAGGRPTLRGLDESDVPYIGVDRQFGGHAGGCNAAFADGSVRFQSRSISPAVLDMMSTLSER